MENRVKLIETTWLQIAVGDWGRPGPGRSRRRASAAPAIRAAAAVGVLPLKGKGAFIFPKAKELTLVTVDLWSAVYVAEVIVMTYRLFIWCVVCVSTVTVLYQTQGSLQFLVGVLVSRVCGSNAICLATRCVLSGGHYSWQKTKTHEAKQPYSVVILR